MTKQRPPNVGLLCADGVEESEVTVPRRKLRDAGFDVRVVTPDGATVRGYNYIEPGREIPADQDLASTAAEQFDCLVLPGGLGGPDTLRNDERAVRLVRRYWDLQRPVAVICHGPWLLIEAGVLEGCRLTCADQIRTDVANAGGRYVDADSHVERSGSRVLVSGRNHQTVEAFADSLVDQLRQAPVAVRNRPSSR